MLRLKTISLLGHPGELDTLPEGKLLINTINAHSYNTARKDAAFAEALLKGDALIPDGASIVLAFKLLRHEKIERIAGWDLFQYEMKKLNAKGGTCFFLGSSEGTLQKIKAKAAGLYPNIRIETYSPPYKAEFSEEDNRRMIEAVNRVTPDLLWVGMTAPKQEKWAYAHLKELDVKGPIGTIGAVFDFFAGNIQRAPLWWQEHSLEWLYRLIKEPKRMWKRYIIGNTIFLGHLLKISQITSYSFIVFHSFRISDIQHPLSFDFFCKFMFHQCKAVLFFLQNRPGKAAACRDLAWYRNQSSGNLMFFAETLHRDCTTRIKKGQKISRYFLYHGFTTLDAFAIVSTISYILVTSPTLSFSVSP